MPDTPTPAEERAIRQARALAEVREEVRREEERARTCRHDEHGRVQKFNGGNPVYLCENCRTILGYVDPEGPHVRRFYL